MRTFVLFLLLSSLSSLGCVNIADYVTPADMAAKQLSDEIFGKFPHRTGSYARHPAYLLGAVVLPPDEALFGEVVEGVDLPIINYLIPTTPMAVEIPSPDDNLLAREFSVDGVKGSLAETLAGLLSLETEGKWEVSVRLLYSATLPKDSDSIKSQIAQVKEEIPEGRSAYWITGVQVVEVTKQAYVANSGKVNLSQGSYSLGGEVLVKSGKAVRKRVLILDGVRSIQRGAAPKSGAKWPGHWNGKDLTFSLPSHVKWPAD